MKRGKLALIACTLALAFTGCILPKEFEARLDVEKDGRYAFHYEGTIVSLGMLADRENGQMDEEQEREAATELMENLKNLGLVTDISYLGNAVFKVSCMETGNVLQRPLRMGLKGDKPGPWEFYVFTFEPSADGTGAVFRFLPDIDSEEMKARYPASGFAMKGTLALTTDLAVESSVGDPFHDTHSGAYIWTVDGLNEKMPAMTLKLKE